MPISRQSQWWRKGRLWWGERAAPLLDPARFRRRTSESGGMGAFRRFLRGFKTPHGSRVHKSLLRNGRKLRSLSRFRGNDGGLRCSASVIPAKAGIRALAFRPTRATGSSSPVSWTFVRYLLKRRGALPSSRLDPSHPTMNGSTIARTRSLLSGSSNASVTASTVEVAPPFFPTRVTDVTRIPFCTTFASPA